MKQAERHNAVINDVTAFGISVEQDCELDEFLDFTLEGEAYEGFEGCSEMRSLECWRQLAKSFAPRGPVCELQDTRKILKPDKANNLGQALTVIQAWETSAYSTS